MTPTLRQLNIFLTLARLRSFTATAAAMGLSQPAISLSVRQLEECLEARLFERKHGGVRLTEHGERFLPMARQIVSATDEHVARFRRIVQTERGLVSISALPSLAAGLVPDAIQAFRSAHPHIYPVLRDVLSDQMLTDVRQGTSDLGVGIAGGSGGELNARTLLTDELVVLVPTDHPLAQESAVTWDRLGREAIVGMDAGSSTRQLVDRTMAEIGVTTNYAGEVSFLATAAAMVTRGFGVTVIPDMGLRLLPPLALVARPLIEPRVTRDISLIWPASRDLPSAADNFFRVLINFTHDHPRLYKGAGR